VNKVGASTARVGNKDLNVNLGDIILKAVSPGALPADRALPLFLSSFAQQTTN